THWRGARRVDPSRLRLATGAGRHAQLGGGATSPRLMTTKNSWTASTAVLGHRVDQNGAGAPAEDVRAKILQRVGADVVAALQRRGGSHQPPVVLTRHLLQPRGRVE